MPNKNIRILRDVNQNAARIAALSTGQPIPQLSVSEEKQMRSEAAAILGRKGGSKGGKMRAAALTAHQRSEIARRAARARWKKR